MFTLSKIRSGDTNILLVNTSVAATAADHSGIAGFKFYLNDRYQNIIDLKDILCSLPRFPGFEKAIEKYAQKDCKYYDAVGNCIKVLGLGLNRLPCIICGLINCTSVMPLIGQSSGLDTFLQLI